MFESPEYLHSEISNPLSLNIKSFNFMVDFIREMHFANIVYFCVINIFFVILYSAISTTRAYWSPGCHPSMIHIESLLGVTGPVSQLPGCVRSALTSDTGSWSPGRPPPGPHHPIHHIQIAVAWELIDTSTGKLGEIERRYEHNIETLFWDLLSR